MLPQQMSLQEFVSNMQNSSTKTLNKCLSFICQAVHVLCQSLITYLIIDHSFYLRFKLVCSQDRCRRQFSTYSGFKKHEKDSCQSSDAANSESLKKLIFTVSKLLEQVSCRAQRLGVLQNKKDTFSQQCYLLPDEQACG